ncbi:Scavenger mRNA decapping enzyme C-term binding family protein [Candida albicans]|uniref:Scavenger mRNA decapping enzyme C-term binding family protein n=1 Tax=Candida albicans TaxID=5476 RepID=A0A8H6BWL2_CANAX|nr:Scavenger mRNA decapping enzyme C-term binding family protein [Candida albicans]
MFPKSTRHLLVIPRNQFTGHELYNMVSGYVEKAKDLIIDELFRYSNVNDKSQLSEFRNTFIKAGVHSIPSLNNLHVHVITQDFHSPRMRNKKHYNSFTTKFFVPFEELNPELNESYLMEKLIKTTPFKCTSCSKTFGNSMVKLKAHLHEEYTKKYASFIVPNILIPNGVCAPCTK